MRRSIVMIDLVGFSDIVRSFEEALGTAATALVQEKLNGIIDHAIETVNRDRSEVMLNDTGDGAALVFSSAVEAYQCAEHCHRRSLELNAAMSGSIVQWCFRIGVATGEIQGEKESPKATGLTISRSKRLESSAIPGEVVIDQATYDSLPRPLQAVFGAEEEIAGKRDETFIVRRYQVCDNCRDNQDGLPPENLKTEERRQTPRSPAPQPVRSADTSNIAEMSYGQYPRSAYEEYIGNYLFYRRSFDDTANLVVSSFRVFWDDEKGCLGFGEKQYNATDHGRVYRYSFTGQIHIASGVGVMSFLTFGKGVVRTISTSLMRDNLSHTMVGVLLALKEISGIGFHPITSPIVLQKLASDIGDEEIRDRVGVYPDYDENILPIIPFMQEAESRCFALSPHKVHEKHGAVLLDLKKPVA